MLQFFFDRVEYIVGEKEKMLVTSISYFSPQFPTIPEANVIQFPNFSLPYNVFKGLSLPGL